MNGSRTEPSAGTAPGAADRGREIVPNARKKGHQVVPFVADESLAPGRLRPGDFVPGTSTNNVPQARRLRRQSGIALIEMALAVPILILLLSGIVQFGGMFFLRSQMVNLARDAARRVAVGDMPPSQVQPFVASGFGTWPSVFTVAVKMPNPAIPSDKDVAVTINVPMSEASLMDIFGMFQTGDLTTKVTMRQE